MAYNEHPFWKKAHAVGIRGESWFAVKLGSPEDKAWREYFAKLGWTPWMLKQPEMLKARTYTMPVQWPGWLPAGFSEGLV
jgi:hypothetical protein